jgi:signal peptide peptidase SppA
MRYEHVLRAFTRDPWAIMPQKLEQIAALLEVKAGGHGEEVRAERIAAALSERRTSDIRAGTAVAVIPVMGVIHQRANIMTETSGGVTTERLSAMFKRAMADPEVGSVLLHIDSPGGAAHGLGEFADLVYSARDVKPVVALIDGYGASAAYWIASAAAEIIVTPSSETGSIGCVMAHVDVSGFEEMEGVKTTLIYAGENKVVANPYAPLSEEDRQVLQAEVDDFNGMFVSGVARNRGVSRAKVDSEFGQGLLFRAKEAVRLGLADRVGTVDDGVARAASLARRGGGGARSRAAAAVAGLEIRERERARGLTGLLNTR